MLDPLTPEEQEQTLAAFKARLENPNVKIERFDARKKEWFPHVNYLWDSNEAHRVAASEPFQTSVESLTKACDAFMEENGDNLIGALKILSAPKDESKPSVSFSQESKGSYIPPRLAIPPPIPRVVKI